MRVWVIAVAGVLTLFGASCTTDSDSDAEQTSRPPAATSPSAQDREQSPNASISSVRRVDRKPRARLDCSGGRPASIVPGHDGWDNLREGARDLLRQPGGYRAEVWKGGSRLAIVVVYLRDDTLVARSAIQWLDGRWFPQTITACPATLN